MRPRVIDCPTDDGVKPVLFYTVQSLEYLLGWRSAYITALESQGKFPQTPYKQERQHPKPILIRLYTETQLKEIRELIELYFPPVYKGSVPKTKTRYKEDMNNYMLAVKELEKRWMEEDYIAKEPPTPKAKKRRPIWKPKTT